MDKRYEGNKEYGNGFLYAFAKACAEKMQVGGFDTIFFNA